MSFGKIYTHIRNCRSTAILAVAKANNVDLELVETDPLGGKFPDGYAEINPLMKIPAFQAKDGYLLTEAIAIAIYITSQNEKTTLLGKTKQDYASILRWMSFGNHEVLPKITGWTRPLTGKDPYNKKIVDDNQKAALKALEVLEKHLLIHTYLVGERITLADLFVAGLVSRGMELVLDKKYRSANPNLTRWYETITAQPIYAAIKKPDFIEEAIKYTPPKKEAAPKKEQAKAAPKPKAKEVAADDDEEEDKPAPKPKHPLELLPKPTLILDDWKRKYSNSETREDALPWFWEHYKPDEYSLWRVDYKYNDELTMIFMTSNLIGGFFNRLEASRKYLFGAASVYGEANNSIVTGAFLVQGHDADKAFDVAPDFESYSFTKLDPAKKEDKEFIEDQWSWDKPVVADGKTYQWADGKVFK
ncbi:MAG: hypothetical protein M1824_006195 [Vezdaea acicularis]|nr:MAG: hypothetical protein M1824_006195 [Vezdaea acicularis]